MEYSDLACMSFFQKGDASFVVMTNYIITPRQKQDKCPEVCKHFHLVCLSPIQSLPGPF